ncbi:hypothetical protein DB35_01770 [Streptomyces abyssalis]|uniref:Lipoprotein n=1 Tax=Streptomyces abyssalis TaxID=933944 RepID=A0A1E7JFH2_9ACTN|nr:hypothetical protein [Streptomyces abyssalis]OEU85221.1 hypothetical protein AN215_21685 [Streptomyces abyssalis]OEU95643.1 hypothetical protein DB35_01770 [Streptomyces abyssalis]OEV29822.1 hypothetical protein AN219_14200 [Streptomyces nanshensis]
MRQARIAMMAAGVVMAAGLTACGGSGGKDSASGSEEKQGLSPAQVAVTELEQASKSTEEKKSAKVEGDQTQGTPRGEISTKTEGTVDWSGGGTTADMTVTQQGSGASGLPTSGKPMPARYTEDAMYVNLGDQFASTAGKGKHWMKYDYDKLAEQSGPSGALVKDQMQNNNPARSVDLLLASGKVKKVGSETVKGKKTDHYSGTIEVAELARMQSEKLSEKELDQLSDQLKQQGFKTEKVDVWIDGDDLLVKKQERAKGKNGDLNSTVFYSDYGTEVSVEAPPASDTLSFEEALPGRS